MYNISKLNIPFSVVVNGANTLLLNVAPYYEYVDGKKTDSQLGYKYTVVEDKTFEKFSVKIASKAPVITQEQIDSSKERLKVTFDNAIAKPYKTFNGEYDLSVTASGITILK